MEATPAITCDEGTPMKTLRSQQTRELAPEADSLRIGMGWSVNELELPQVMVESSFGDSHPGSAHLDRFVRQKPSDRAVFVPLYTQ